MSTQENLAQPKKPPSSYFLFANEKKGKGETTKAAEIAAQWKALSGEDKRPYEEKAQALRATFNQELEAFKQAGGVVARAARGTRTAGKIPPQKAPGKKGEEQVQVHEGRPLHDIPDDELLAEVGRRLASRRVPPNEQPMPKRSRTAGEGSTGPIPETKKTPAAEDIEAAFEATGGKIKRSEERGFKLWIEARWEKFSEEAATAKPKQIGAFGKQKWDKLSEDKKGKWCGKAS